LSDLKAYRNHKHSMQHRRVTNREVCWW